MSQISVLARQVGLVGKESLEDAVQPVETEELAPVPAQAPVARSRIADLASQVGLISPDASVRATTPRSIIEPTVEGTKPAEPMFGGDLTSVPNVLGEMSRDVVSGAKKLGGQYVDAVKNVTRIGLDHTKPFGPLKVLAGGMEGGAHFAAGAASWIAGKSASEIVNVIDHAMKLDPSIQKEYGDQLTPEGIAKHRKEWEERIGGFLPKVLGEPRTEVAKESMQVLGDVMEFGTAPMYVAADFYADHGYPNVGLSLAFVGELLAFKGAHKVTGKVKKSLGKMQEKLQKSKVSELDPELQAINEALQTQKVENKAVLSALNTEHRIFLKNEHQRALQAIKQSELPSKEKRKALKAETDRFNQLIKEGEAQLAEMQKNKQLAKQAEREGKTLDQLIQERIDKNQQAIDAQWPEIYEGAKKEISSGKPLFQESSGEGPGTIYEQSGVRPAQVQPGPRGTGTPMSAEQTLAQRPNLGPEAARRAPETALETQSRVGVEQVTEETIPQKEYRIGPDGKPELVRDISERQTFQLDETGKPQLVENIPGQRQVWQILRKPFESGGETGAIDIGGFIELFGKAPKGLSLLSRLQKLGLSKADLELSGMGAYLRKQGDKRVNIKELADIAQEAGPISKEVFAEGQTKYAPTKDGFDRLTLPGFEPGTYREVMYKFKPEEGVFNEPHFPGKQGENAMAHARVHDRVVEGSKKVVHMDEIQSKLHDIGSQEGYKKSNTRLDRYRFLDRKKNKTAAELEELKKLENDLVSFVSEEGFDLEKVPDAPFKQDWHKMIARDMVSDAVARDMEGVSWNTAEILRKRYPKVKADFEMIYDQRMVKFFENEMGVKPKKVKTEILTLQARIALQQRIAAIPREIEKAVLQEVRDTLSAERHRKQNLLRSPYTSKEVWYVPLTEKMKRLYKSEEVGKQAKLVDPDQPYIDKLDALYTRLRKEKYMDTAWEKTALEISNLTEEMQRSAQMRKNAATIPTQQSVFEIMLEPLRNQKGEINVDLSQNKFREKVSPENRMLLLNIGKQAEAQGKSVAQVLREGGMSPEKVSAFSELYNKAKIERPFGGGLEPPPVPSSASKAGLEDFTPLKLKPGERQVNVGKKNNKHIKVGTETLRMLKDLPRMLTGDIPMSFRTPWSFFDALPGLKPLHYMARDAKLSYHKDRVIVVKAVQEMRKLVRSVKMREEIGAYHMGLSESGQKAMVATGQQIPKSKPQHYDRIMPKINEITKDLYEKINENRLARGQSKLPFTEDYFAFFLKENMADSFQRMFIKDPTREAVSLTLDSAQAIEGRHAILEDTVFPHLRRGIVPKGIKLELDPLKMILRYADSGLRHVHYSNLVGFVREIAGKDLRDPVTGEAYNMAHWNPKAANYLGSWVNKMAGVDNVTLPKSVNWAMNKISENLTAAILMGNLRTVLIQPTALASTYMVYGLPRTMQGVVEAAMRKREPLLELSTELPTRLMDAAMSDPGRSVAGGMYERGQAGVRAVAMAPMKAVDGFIFEASLRTAINKLRPELEAGRITPKELMRQADDMAIRTNASGAVEELSPFQRNAVGKSIGLWQTFTINHMNFMATEMLGLGKANKLSKAEVMKRTMRMIVGVALINHLFEDRMGITAPFPRPIKTLVDGLTRRDSKGNPDPDPAVLILLNTAMEFAQFAPVIGGLKYGTSPAGAVQDHFQELTDMLAGTDVTKKNLIKKAMQGDKKAAFEVGSLLAKLSGVTASGQAAKYARGRSKGEGQTRSLLGRAWGDEKDQADMRKEIAKRQKKDLGFWNFLKPKKTAKKTSGRTSRSKRSKRSSR